MMKQTEILSVDRDMLRSKTTYLQSFKCRAL